MRLTDLRTRGVVDEVISSWEGLRSNSSSGYLFMIYERKKDLLWMFGISSFKHGEKLKLTPKDLL